MANEKHLAILREGIPAWNGWRKGTQEIPNLNRANLNLADLSNANLSGADLIGADLRATNLTNANLNGADLQLADARRAILIKAYLVDANLTSADFSNADLSNANLCSADLSFADLHGADLGNVQFDMATLFSTKLRGAKLKNATFAYTRFADCDLSEVQGLDLTIHEGPSTIGIDTIYESKGKVAESFLRECGVPEGFITQMRSLVDAEEGIQFYSCFISYSTKEEEFARRLHGRMRDARLRVWFAPEDIQGGKKVHEQIETAIRVYDKLLIVLSEASLQSEWVMTELRKARKAERQTGKRKLFPVRLVDFETLQDWECFDANSGKDLAVELREYFIPNFSNWKDHDQFEVAFSRLLKDLRAE
jgi:hypothetical protein